MAAAPLTGQVTATGVAQKLDATGATPTYWILKAPSTNGSRIYIGGATVTTANGYPMEAGEQLEIDRRPAPGAVFDITPGDIYVVGSNDGSIAAWLAFR